MSDMPSCAPEQEKHTSVAVTPIINIILKHENSGNMEASKSDPQTESEIEVAADDKTKKGIQMELRTNASTDDLLSLESGNQTPENVDSSVNNTAVPASTVVQENGTPVPTPHATPSTRRKSHNTLRLNLDETTWTQTDQVKPPATVKFRQNLQAGAARFSAVVQRGKTPEFRFRLVLVFLFGSIIALVAFTWYLYQRQMLQLTFEDKIRFHELQRVIHLLNGDGKEVLHGVLGLHIPSQLSPYDCQLLYPLSGPNMCAEWKYRARLQINYTHAASMSCYNVHWESLSQKTKLRDCFSLKGAHWYGMGEIQNISWPLTGITDRQQPFVTGDLAQDDFGAVLERYWLSSEGVAIRVLPDVPLYISLNSSGNENLCLEARYDGFPYHYPQEGLPLLEYTICTGPDMKTVHKGMIQKYFELPNNITNNDFLSAPVWASGPSLGKTFNQGTLQTYANHIKEYGFQAGFILIDTIWQQEEGDLQFNNEIFPKPQDILKILHNKGFKILLTVHPYVCMGSGTFKNGTEGQYFLSDSQWGVPLLTRWQEKVCAIIDMTSNHSAQWFLSRITDIKNEYNIDGFVFTGGQSSFLPRFYNFHITSSNPDSFLSHYLAVASETGPLMGVSIGFRSQHVPAFVRLAPRTSTWDPVSGLQSIIPAVLTLGLLGYPIVNPGSVGGDILNITDKLTAKPPEKELYMRWLQLAAFMPVVQFSVPPGDYQLDVIKATKVLFKVREERVFPVMQKLIQEYLISGAPIIRPLWWLAPKDSNAQVINSQFTIGSEIIVAPVLEEKKRARDIYLPPGRWRDEILGASRLGGKWMYNYSVPLDKVAYFTKIEE